MMINLYILELINFLKTELSLYADVKIGQLSTDQESIALRVMPSGNTNYYAGKRTRHLQFQILTKSRNYNTASNTLEQIADKLIEYGCDVYSEPSFLQKDEQGYVCTAGTP